LLRPRTVSRSRARATEGGCRYHVQHRALPSHLREQARATDLSKPRVIVAAGTERSAAREGRHQQRYAHRRATLRGRCTRKGWRRNGNGLAAWGATSTGRPEQASTRFPCQGTSAFGSRSTRSAAAEDLACAAAWEAGRSIREKREIRIVDHLRILRGLTKEIRVATH
jgi:hypothetical protein